MKRLLGLIAIVSLSAAAADISGKWKGTADTPNGTFERTFSFKVDGNKLTGESESSFTGKSTIDDGKVDGDNVSFSVVIDLQGEKRKINYKGKVSPSGNEIKFNAQSADGELTLEYNAKRVS